MQAAGLHLAGGARLCAAGWALPETHVGFKIRHDSVSFGAVPVTMDVSDDDVLGGNWFECCGILHVVYDFGGHAVERVAVGVCFGLCSSCLREDQELENRLDSLCMRSVRFNDAGDPSLGAGSEPCTGHRFKEFDVCDVAANE